MPQARSDTELLRMFRSPIMKAINYVVEKIAEENVRAIHDIVYMAYTPKEYGRSGGFYTAWGANPTKQLNESTSRGEFAYKPENMGIGDLDPQSDYYAQHIGVGPNFYGQDARPYLAELIYEGETGKFFGEGDFRKKRNAWRELNRRIGRRKMKQWMKEGLEAAGLNVKMHNVPLDAKMS